MLLLYLLPYLTLTFGFNLEVRKSNVWEFSDPTPDANSFFGYQVSLHPGASKPTLFVAAPRNTGTNPSGAVFQCTTDDKNTCAKFNINKENSVHSQAKIDAQNTNQWLGMSLSQAGDSLMACAPLWHFNTTNRRTGAVTAWYEGRCSLIGKDTLVVYTKSACEGLRVSNQHYGYCESGFSSAGTTGKDRRAYYMGAPGSVNFRGRVFGFVEDTSTGKTVTLQSPGDRIDVVSSYLGYAVTVGRFTGNEYEDVVGGAPRAGFLKGIAILYTVDDDGFAVKTTFQNPEDQVGSYFGAALCAIDVNNDGKDDLLVGAPHHSKVYDEGKVYIYMNDKEFKGLDLQKEGLQPEKKTGARFGETITNIGDLNKDGYLDVAISAPGGGPDGRGAVYIYNGAANGLHTQYSQMIAASDYIEPTASGFGSSISNGLDVDGDDQMDLAIGSYRSAKAVLFRSRPIVTLSDALETNITQVPPEANMTNCVGPDGDDYHCIELKVNLEYNGKGNFNDFDVELTLEIDNSRIIRKRGFVLNPVTNKLESTFVKNVTLSKDKISPISTVLYVSVTGEVDILAPIELKTKYRAFESLTGVCGSGTCPIVDVYGTSSSSLQVTYLRRCGSDNTCHTDLSVADFHLRIPKTGEKDPKEIIYGAVYELEAVAKIKNLGETSYQSFLKMNYSSDLSVSGVEINGKSDPFWKPITLDDDSQSGLSVLLASTMNQNSEINVRVKFSITKARPSTPKYVFDLAASGIGVDTDDKNNKKSLDIETKIETCIKTSGDVIPSSVVYKEDTQQPKIHSNTSVEDIGPEVNFTFYVQNSGNLAVDTLLTDIDFIVKKEQKELIYVVDLLVDGVRCDPKVNQLNPRKFQLVQAGVEEKNDIQVKTRKRRDTSDSSDTVMNCRHGSCRTFSCNITKIDKGQGSKVFAVTRVWAANLAELKLKPTRIETRIDVKFNGPDRARNVQKAANCPLTAKVYLQVSPSTSSIGNKVDWWIILLAVLGALILLAICAAFLYRLGFFKRKRKINEITGPAAAPPPSQQDQNDDDDDDDEQ